MQEIADLPFGTEVIEKIKNLSVVEAIGVHGSYVYGELDEYSDLDLVAVCSEIPSPEAREEFLGGLVDKINRDFEVPERFLEDIDYIQVDENYLGIDYVKADYLEGLVDKLEDGESIPKDEIEDAIKFLYYSEVVWDPEEILVSLKERMPEADPSAARYFLYDLEKINLDGSWPKASLSASISRKNYLQISKIFNRAIESYILALCVINGEYYGGPKNAAFTMDKLDHKPEDCWKRLQRISKIGNSKEEVKEKVEIFQDLRRELFEIIEEQEELDLSDDLPDQ